MSDARPHRRLRLPRLRLWSRPCDFWAILQEMGADFAMGLDFWVVFRRRYAAPTSLTWGNVGVLKPFGPNPPAKPPRSREWALRRLHCGLRASMIRALALLASSFKVLVNRDGGAFRRSARIR